MTAYKIQIFVETYKVVSWLKGSHNRTDRTNAEEILSLDLIYKNINVYFLVQFCLYAWRMSEYLGKYCCSLNSVVI